jgi:hypothetical protein
MYIHNLNGEDVSKSCNLCFIHLPLYLSIKYLLIRWEKEKSVYPIGVGGWVETVSAYTQYYRM